jgi:sterol desaturase/sphingolipid hydroxylase (fatty acid hydroxylase superfamily)
MSLHDIRMKVRAELESPKENRALGSGWLSGVIALMASVAGLFFVLCLRFPWLLTVPPLRPYYDTVSFRLGLHFLLIFAFVMSAVNMALRADKILGATAVCITLFATILGGSHTESTDGQIHGVFFGLDWFVLNVVLTGFLFIPLERIFARNKGQTVFREEWREDLFYYLVSSLLVQVLTFLSMTPAIQLAAHTHWTTFRQWVGSQPVVLEIIEIMFLTDLVQYWVHRLFHRIPFLWGFHSVHHSAKSLDWMAGARMHFMEIIVLRGATVIPMYIMGFSAVALHVYILLVYVHSSLVHANIGWNFDHVGKYLVTPRFHHWHHGIDKEAIDVNFAIHFPLLDRVFGTYHLPPHEWPSGYGIENHPVPRGYWKQFMYPFRKR